MIVTHRNIVRLVDDSRYAELGPGTMMLHAASPAFDATTLEIWGPLVNGGTIAPLPEQPSPDAVAAAIEAPRRDDAVADRRALPRAGRPRPDVPRPRSDHVLAGGDVVSPAHVERALAALPPGGRFSNGYGPTEGTTFATTWTLRPGDPVDAPLPIGRPVRAPPAT